MYVVTLWKYSQHHDEHAFRVEFFGDEIDRIREIEALTGQVLGEVDHLAIFPATHFMTNDDRMERVHCQD